MKIKLFHLVCLILLQLPFYCNGDDRVLLISSYNSSFPTFFQQIDGVKSVFDTAGIKVDVEFMDAKRFNNDGNFKLFEANLTHKLKGPFHYKAVLACDDHAFNFVLDHADSLFHDLPLIFCGVNNRTKALDQNNNPQVSGVLEAVSMKETIELMHHYFPASRNIYVIADDTPGGLADLETYYMLQPDFEQIIFHHISLSKLTFAEFAGYLQKIPENAPVLLLSAYHDKNGNTLDFDESLSLIKKNLKSPLFHLWYHGIGKGIFGGKVISHFEQAKQAALMVYHILHDKNCEEIPVLEDSPNIYVIDYKELKKYGVNDFKLPENAILINEEVSFCRKNASLLMYFGGILSFLLVLIIFLMRIIKKSKNLEKTLLQKSENYRKLNAGYLEQNAHLKEAKEKAEESERLKSAFLVNVSHEIRTPMNGILGFASLLSDNNPEPDEQREYIEIIKRSGNRMLNTINDIIDISKIESGSAVIRNSEVCPYEALKDLYRFFLPETKRKGLKFSFIAHENKNRKCLLDLPKFNSIINNLLKNAINYTKEGEVKIELAFTADEKMIIKIMDTGPGIDKDKHILIFERFIRLEVPSDKIIDGSGLGLAITKSYAEMMNGKVTLDSEPGRGSVFTVILPCKPIGISEDDKAKGPAQDEGGKKWEKLKLLLVDDDIVSQNLLKIGLKNVSDHLLFANNGRIAVQTFKENPDTDLILMDLKMPEMDGFEAVRLIREINQEVFIIAQTAYAQAGDEARALNSGCDAYISKPIDIQLLKQMIMGFLKKR